MQISLASLAQGCPSLAQFCPMTVPPCPVAQVAAAAYDPKIAALTQCDHLLILSQLTNTLCSIVHC